MTWTECSMQGIKWRLVSLLEADVTARLQSVSRSHIDDILPISSERKSYKSMVAEAWQQSGAG